MQGLLLLSRTGMALMRTYIVFAVLLCCLRNIFVLCVALHLHLHFQPAVQQGTGSLLCATLISPPSMYAMLPAHVQEWILEVRIACCAHVQPPWCPFGRWIPRTLAGALQLQVIVAGQQQFCCSATCTVQRSESHPQEALEGQALLWQM
jgi:hypothetical protein